MSFVKQKQDTAPIDDGVVRIREYGGSDSLDAAFAKITGNYPKNGFVMNTECDMMYLVIKGSGQIYFKIDDKLIDNYLMPGSMAFIAKGTPYRVESLGTLEVWIPSSPRWSSSQYKEIS